MEVGNDYPLKGQKQWRDFVVPCLIILKEVGCVVGSTLGLKSLSFFSKKTPSCISYKSLQSWIGWGVIYIPQKRLNSSILCGGPLIQERMKSKRCLSAPSDLKS